MAEHKDQHGNVFLRHEHGDFQVTIPPNPLLLDGHDFGRGNLLVTKWGGVLPPVGFSFALFKLVQKLAEQERPRRYRKEAAILSRYLLKRERVTPMAFDPEMGCWDMELLGGPVDEEGRARYPAGSIKDLGYTNGRTGMHQITYEVFRGVKIPIITSAHKGRVRRTDVDHLCREHECCNPFHLQAVPPEVNTQRGNTARLAIVQPHFHSLEPGERSYREILDHCEEYGLGERRQRVAKTAPDSSNEEEVDALFDHPVLF